jgi:hypothetical protein
LPSGGHSDCTMPHPPAPRLAYCNTLTGENGNTPAPRAWLSAAGRACGGRGRRTCSECSGCSGRSECSGAVSAVVQ